MSEVNEALPLGWKWSTLQEVVRAITYGHTASATDEPVGPRFLRITDIQNGRVNWDTVPYCRCDDIDKYALKNGDIVIARTGATTGKSFLIGELAERSVFASYLIRLQTVEDLSAAYLSRFMQTPHYWRQITTVSKGSAQPGANASILSKLAIPVAPLAEQRRIVSKIESLQERSARARDALSEVGPLLEQFRQSVLRAAFTGRLTADWRAVHPDIEPASELLTRIRTERRHRWEQAELAKHQAKGKQPPINWQDKYQEPRVAKTANLPQLPDGWCWATLDELLSEPLANGRSVIDGNGTPVLRLTALRNRRIDLNETKLGDWTAEQAQKFFVHENDFLVSRGNGSIDLVGRGGIVPKPETPTAFPDTLIRVRLTERVTIGLFALLWDSRLVREQVESAAKTTAGIYKVSQSDLEAFVVPVIPEFEQLQITVMLAEALRSVDEMAQGAAESKVALKQLDQSILAKAFRGELVPQDPRDEPASELLARIRTTCKQAEHHSATPKNTQPPRKKKAKAKP